jgi:hypothetical protein
MKKIFLLLSASLFSISSAFSQDQENPKKEWGFKVEPYLMAPYMKGTVAIGKIPQAEIDANAGEVFDRLRSAFMLYGETNNGKWAITGDFVYMKLQETIEPNGQINSGEINFDETIFAMEGLYRILPWLEFGIGGRVVTIGGDMTVSRTELGSNGETNVQQAEKTESWFDPTVLFRAQVPNSGKWIGELKADIGGFGIGSNETYQIQVNGGYRFSKLFQATAGYRALSIDYESGTTVDRFNYDVKTTGPVVRLGFNF